MNTENRLSDFFREYPDAVESVVALNEHDFARLRNPYLRKIMSPRITLARVAAMVNRSPASLATYFTEAGYPVEAPNVVPQPLPAKPAARPSWLHDVTFWVSVLPQDDAGQDPMPAIMSGIKRLQRGEVMGIRHRWEPQPLFDVWSKLGLQFWTEQQSENEWHIFVYSPHEVQVASNDGCACSAC